jgi:transcriptional regulator with PAS, ATPase and Fis domain
MPNATIAEDPRLPRPKEVEGTARMPSSGAKAVPARASDVEALPPRSKPKLEIAKPNGAPALRQFGRVSARSAAMHDVFEVLDRFVSTDVSITLVGETGAGKDVLAHAVHEQSPRAGGPLVVFDCGAVAANLAESELLGHERGAFTGAVTGHAGAFERAHGGTLFLDEIAELPLDLQSRLLRALESRKVRRVGGRLDRRVDVRVIAATNRDLRADVAAGRFREDLFFRLAVAVVPVPPLRKRTEDLPELTRGLLNDLGRPEIRLSEAAEALLRAHAWPGNVRELKNALSCATAFVDPGETVLDTHHLRLLGGGQGDGAWVDELPLAGQALERIERAAIRQTMSLVKGNKMEAARVLGIAPSTLYEKLKKYAL